MAEQIDVAARAAQRKAVRTPAEAYAFAAQSMSLAAAHMPVSDEYADGYRDALLYAAEALEDLATVTGADA